MGVSHRDSIERTAQESKRLLISLRRKSDKGGKFKQVNPGKYISGICSTFIEYQSLGKTERAKMAAAKTSVPANNPPFDVPGW